MLIRMFVLLQNTHLYVSCIKVTVRQLYCLALKLTDLCCTVLTRYPLIITGSKSQNALWNAITAGIGIRDKDKRGILIDPRSPEEILSDELPAVDSPDAMEKTAIRLGRCYSFRLPCCRTRDN